MIFNLRCIFGISLTVVIFLLISYSYTWNFLIIVNFLGYNSETRSFLLFWYENILSELLQVSHSHLFSSMHLCTNTVPNLGPWNIKLNMDRRRKWDFFPGFQSKAAGRSVSSPLKTQYSLSYQSILKGCFYSGENTILPSARTHKAQSNLLC